VPGLLKQLLDARRTHHPVQALPTEGWCQGAGLGRMSLVWPWYAVDDPQPLVDAHGRDIGIRPAIEIRAPRTDCDLALIVWREPGGGIVSGAEWAAATARLHGGSLDRTCPIAINGAMGHLARVRMPSGSDIVWRIIVPRDNATAHFEVSVPARHADAYWPQIDSMLATWGWDD
jgi:hypothetical protein